MPTETNGRKDGQTDIHVYTVIPHNYTHILYPPTLLSVALEGHITRIAPGSPMIIADPGSDSTLRGRLRESWNKQKTHFQFSHEIGQILLLIILILILIMCRAKGAWLAY